MKTLLFSTLFSLFLVLGFAQELKFKEPDYKKIKKESTKRSSENSFKKLLERYNNYDTTLRLENFRYLYYGFFYQSSFSVLGHSTYSDSLVPYLNKDTLTESDYNSIIKYENLVLEEYPFNLRDLNTLSYAYEQLGNALMANKTAFKMNNIIETILSTGDGKTEETAWHVNSIGHEYDMLGVLGFNFGGEQKLTKKGCDYLKVAENDYKVEGFYFDVNQILEKEGEMFK